MKHAVIVGHPDEHSFNLSIARTYAQTVEALGHECVVRDLYRMAFDPCLKASERPDRPNPRIEPDVQAEHALLRDADVFAFIYPIWFGMPPAIMKGYLDRVFTQGFAFDGLGHRRSVPLLGGRRFISFTTSGASDAWLNEQGVSLSLQTLFDKYLGDLWGVTVVDHVHYAPITANLGEHWAKTYLGEVKTKVQGRFGGSTV